jgi:2-polyprenyl-6-methoxyphenol hydroxylase-like FAD-dependent oxidoreductase
VAPLPDVSRPISASGHAIVVGASMSGLCVAAALADSFGAVTVVDRDRLPVGAGSRRGVPQDRHLHLLLPAGAAALDELFPGVLQEMSEDGAASGDADVIRVSVNGHRLASARLGQSAVFTSRPFIESHVRRRVRDASTISLEEGITVRDLVAEQGGGRVRGARVATLDDRQERTLPADLVVDCSGRASRTPRWLSDFGYEPPAVEEVQVDVRYTTRQFDLSSDALDGDHHVLVGPTRTSPRGGAMTRVQPDRWMVTLFGMGGDEVPPKALDGFRDYARSLPIADIHEAIQDGDAIGEPATYRFPANVRRRYGDGGDFPAGLLVAGDAVCSFNPIYGQGMSVAALEAVTLRRLLRRGALADSQAWFRAIGPTVDDAWELAVGADLAVEAIEAERSLRTRILSWYLRQYHAAARRDPALSSRFLRVAGMLDRPSSLLHPTAIARVLRGAIRTSTGQR